MFGNIYDKCITCSFFRSLHIGGMKQSRNLELGCWSHRILVLYQSGQRSRAWDGLVALAEGAKLVNEAHGCASTTHPHPPNSRFLIGVDIVGSWTCRATKWSADKQDKMICSTVANLVDYSCLLLNNGLG